MPTLTAQQAQAVHILDWLLSDDLGDRRTGRTTAIALAYLRFAAMNPDRWVYIHDHTAAMGDRTGGNGNLLRTIQVMAEEADLHLSTVRQAPAHQIRIVRNELTYGAVERFLAMFTVDPYLDITPHDWAERQRQMTGEPDRHPPALPMSPLAHPDVIEVAEAQRQERHPYRDPSKPEPLSFWHRLRERALEP
jgi:hypothetical protein